MTAKDTLVTLHDGGGSMVEAAQPVAAFGPFTSDEANKIVKYGHKLLAQHPDDHIRRECWLQTIPYAMAPTVSTMPDGTPVPVGHQAVDVGAMLNALTERD